MSKPRKLDSELFHHLHFISLATGGVGGGSYLGIGDIPICIHGMCMSEGYGSGGAMRQKLMDVGIYPSVNDDAVAAINKRRRKAPRTRVSFEAWCKELNVVPRG